MAALPTLQDVELVILEIFKARNARPGEIVNLHAALNPLMAGDKYRSDDFNNAIKSMLDKEWITAVRGGLFHSLTELGYLQV